MNVGDLGKLVVAKGFKKLPKVQKIAQSGHTVARVSNERLDTFGNSLTQQSLKMHATKSKLRGVFHSLGFGIFN